MLFFRDVGTTNAWNLEKTTRNINWTAPSIEVHCLYGSNVATVEKFVYNFVNI